MLEGHVFLRKYVLSRLLSTNNSVVRKSLLKFVSLTLISLQEGMETPKKNVALVGSKKTAEVRLPAACV